MTETIPLVDEIEVRRALKRAVTKAGGYGIYARKIGSEASNIAAVCNGDWPPGDRILKALGFERAVRYRQVRVGL